MEDIRMSWVSRKMYLYNVIMGSYVLDWWERYIYNTMLLLLLWFVFSNIFKAFLFICNRFLKV